MKVSIDELNMNKAPSQTVGDYLIYDLIGAGAFGSVFKVKRNSGRQLQYYAMKEVKTFSYVTNYTVNDV